MPSKKSSKNKRRIATPVPKNTQADTHRNAPMGKYGKPWVARKYAGKRTYPKPKTSKPDIHVKKSTYSKTARLMVLSSAEARQKLIEMGGENTIDIIREFDKDMSDEELARKTGVKASDVRVVLNRLHNHGLFSYTRVRDRDSGWYSYIWKMSEGRLKELSDELLQGTGLPEAEGLADGENYSVNNKVMGILEEETERGVVERRRR